MQIVKGKVNAPVRAVIYGPSGIGKTTLASQWPHPVFIDVESGTLEMDVNRISLGQSASWQLVLEAVKQLRNSEYQTIIIDTADWAEKLLKEKICNAAGVSSIGDIPYGALYQQLAAEWAKFLDELSSIKKNIVLLAHSCLVHCDIPEENGSFDRHEMKMTNSFKISIPALCKEWASIVLFINYETRVVEGKASGGKRYIYTTWHTCWDAKQRTGMNLPEKMQFMDGKIPAELAALFKPAKTAPPVEAVKAAPTEEKPAPVEAVKQEPAANPLYAQLEALFEPSGVTVDQLQAEIGRKGICPANMLPSQYNEATLKRIIGNWDKVVANIRIMNKGA